jgi:hypothetical protein
MPGNLCFTPKVGQPIEFALRREAGCVVNARLTVTDITPKSVITLQWVTKRRITDCRFKLAKNQFAELSLGGHKIVVVNNGRKSGCVQLAFEAPEIVRIWRFGFLGSRD